VREQQVGLIIPTNDSELLLLSNARDEFAREGTHAVVSDVSFVEKCRDKRLTGLLFASAGIRYPKIFDWPVTRFPIFAKPYSGSASIDARLIERQQDLPKQPADLIFMEPISAPFREYTVDCYFDRSSILRCAVPRLRIETRAGEVSKSETRKNGLYQKVLSGLEHWKAARGCLTVQIFYDEENDDPVGLEVNPRFGGGFPLSYSAGANYPGWLIDEYLMQRPVGNFSEWKDKLLMLRYDSKVLINATSR
jgi:carbamoyl-phosphate synthase large subunit